MDESYGDQDILKWNAAAQYSVRRVSCVSGHELIEPAQKFHAEKTESPKKLLPFTGGDSIIVRIKKRQKRRTENGIKKEAGNRHERYFAR